MKKTTVTVYLDIDNDGNDLLDSAGNLVKAGWYVYEWPFDCDPFLGPFDSIEEANRQGK